LKDSSSAIRRRPVQTQGELTEEKSKVGNFTAEQVTTNNSQLQLIVCGELSPRLISMLLKNCGGLFLVEFCDELALQ
jgi:hypothetical protein